MNIKRKDTDVVIIGSGLSGLMAAVQLAETHDVTLVTKTALGSGNSERAQGGIAASYGEAVLSHKQDTLAAGYGHTNGRAAGEVIEKAASVMNTFMSWQTPFDRDEKREFLLAREGAHSCRRIFRAGGDAAGHYMMKQLKKNIPANLRVLEFFTAFDLVMEDGRCAGVTGRDNRGECCVWTAGAVVVASGGCGRLFPVTSNAPEASGDGLGMAFRAGAVLQDMEFLQFHPTMLTGGGLVSEAVRGEGAVLVDEHGNRLMKGRHPLEDLAPRSVTARVVREALKAGKEVFLDIRSIPRFEKEFPRITEQAERQRIDPEKGFLPVRPGAHFMMGGIAADAAGQTSIKGLYAIGEAACSGMHGANRLAGNSLLEAAAGAFLLAERIAADPDVTTPRPLSLPVIQGGRQAVLPEREELQEKMDAWCGIIRDRESLEWMKNWLGAYESNIFTPAEASLSLEQLEVKNMLTAAWMMTGASLLRQESRGAHIRRDIPEQRKEWTGAVIRCESGRFTVVHGVREEGYAAVSG
ncbi:L-aspartate oxidase [Salibacterium lacus]|uniref:L-aspartate oxidase n=1 Tax=Salibacterium lacus TaxID=1898109 RepID=A0ABW5T277_9BACI